MSDPVSENGTPWNQLPGATGGIRRKMTKRPTGTTGGNFFLDMVGGIIRSIMGIFLPGGSGVPGMPSGMNPLEFLSDLMGMRWEQLDTVTDGQLELNDRTDLLSPLLDYGSCFANGSGGISQIGRVPFNQKVGPMNGCRLESNGIVLEDQGLWQINARLAFSWTIGPGAQTWRIRVYRPNGTLFSEQLDYSSESNENTREMLTTVVVPDAGYRVEVWITELIIGRATIGGPQNNRLTVQHISRSTDFPI